jgi:CRISPR-associated endonuclease/helicase Cas3
MDADSMNTFAARFKYLTGDDPFPWQRHLFERLVHGPIPEVCDIPTGLGKTNVMTIWLVARAVGAALPRRLVYVVDRRAVVDQATEVAEGLRDRVDRDPDLKQALGLGSRSLPISTIRGKHVDNKEWLDDPAVPAIIVGTVDMIGSRLLFEGYGTSRKMRPYHAGLLGADAMVVLDESHLVPPFEKLLETIADPGSAFGSLDEELRALVPHFKLLSLSATGRRRTGEPCGLTEDDLRPGTVTRRRLDAPKRLTVFLLNGQVPMADALAKEAWKLAEDGKRAVRCIVFCNERRVAKATHAAIETVAKGNKTTGVPAVDVGTELFVGGRRVFEREAAADRLRELGFLRRVKREPTEAEPTNTEQTRPAFVFATSAGEVGVDLDADHMVCDLVAWERMVQRLGRVNRRGEGEANVVVLVEPKPKSIEDALKKPASERTKREFELLAKYEASMIRAKALELLPRKSGAADASPGALRALKLNAERDSQLQAIIDAATTPAPLRPALSRPLVDAWSMTSLKEHTGRPEIVPWLRGWVKGDPPQTAVVWRTYLPVRATGTATTDKEIEAFFEAAPPHASEILETDTYQVVEWLIARANSLISSGTAQSGQVERGANNGTLFAGEDAVAIALTPAGDFYRKWQLIQLAPADDVGTKTLRDELDEYLAGATLVVDARIRGLKQGLLDHAATGPLRTVDDGKPWMAPTAAEPPVVRFQIRTADAGQSSTQNPQWRERLRLPIDQSEDGEPTRWLVVEKWLDDAATEEDRSEGRPQMLEEHQEWTEQRARDLADRLRLPAEYSEMLAIAGRLHDEGKQAKRWQRAFNANSDGIYAKTRGPLNVALLDGYRHEFGSLPFAVKDPRLRALPDDLQDLALHLIAAHHGFARPVISTESCEDAPPSALKGRARDVALRFARLQKRWGPWGLAWWEALLRSADQEASRDNDRKDRVTGREVE